MYVTNASSSDTVAVRIPATETAAMLMSLCRKCRSCAHGILLLGTSK